MRATLIIGSVFPTMNYNIVRYIFIFISFSLGSIALLMNCAEAHLPIALRRSFRYGKYSLKGNSKLAALFEVPKSWYKHFYLFAGPTSTFILCALLSKYLFNGSTSENLLTLLDVLFGDNRKPLVSVESAILAAVLLNVQCWKRIYESCYVSVFSDQKMNVLYYIIGIAHYTGTLLSVISECEGFVRGSHMTLYSAKPTFITLICAIILLWSSYLQLKTNFILKSLRKNRDDIVVTYDYKVPTGELFEYVSCPLQLTEIIIYLMLSMILWDGSTIHYITVFVIINQIECAYLSHLWYCDTFKDYPKTRKVLIPYIW